MHLLKILLTIYEDIDDLRKVMETWCLVTRTKVLNSESHLYWCKSSAADCKAQLHSVAQGNTRVKTNILKIDHKKTSTSFFLVSFFFLSSRENLTLQERKGQFKGDSKPENYENFLFTEYNWVGSWQLRKNPLYRLQWKSTQQIQLRI